MLDGIPRPYFNRVVFIAVELVLNDLIFSLHYIHYCHVTKDLCLSFMRQITSNSRNTDYCWKMVLWEIVCLDEQLRPLYVK